MYNNIVLVADIFEHTEENINFNSTTLEKPSQEYIRYYVALAQNL